MLKNNNHMVIKRMAKISLKSSWKKSLVMLAAIFFSTFMVFSVLTAGITYFQMWRLQNLRLQGGEYDAIMYGCSDGQMKLLQENEDVTEIGVSSISGCIVETEKTDVSEIMLMWEDDISWNVMGAPARTSLKGHYPVKENEVMVTEKALKEGGLGGYGIGDSFYAKWLDGNGKKHTTEFVISGVWDGYGNKSHFKVSEAFYEKSGYELSNPNDGRILLDIRQKLLTRQQKNDFIESMKLKKMQAIVFTTELANALPIYFGLLGLLIVICLCAWLLIYNIMYLSVTGNIRYYGLLQTVGMTGKQIYDFLYRQLSVLGAVGTITGTGFAMGISFFVIPSVVRAFGISEKVDVVFQPFVFVLTVVLSSLTILFAGRKPAKIAASVSPVEASRYVGNIHHAGYVMHVRESGSIIWRMGVRKVMKDRKKTAVIALSLSLGLSVFLCIITLIKSQGPRTIADSAWGDDLEIINKTLRTDEAKKWKELWNGELEHELTDIPGVKAVHLVKTAKVLIPWEPEFSDLWMKKIYERWILDPYEPFMQEYKTHPEDFETCLVGIDEKSISALNETLEQPLDEKAFLEGKTCVVYQNGLDIGIKELAEKRVGCVDAGNTDHAFDFEIAG
ncbi:MAG: ABC transporter permease, partial [Butyrivibrio sp.]|nr:ABC transporter permease [Butyrivibrio sp.]